MDSPEIRELEQFANEFKVRRIKLGMSLLTAKGQTTLFANLTLYWEIFYSLLESPRGFTISVSPVPLT